MKQDTLDHAMSSATVSAELLTTLQAAELCGVGERTLWRWSHSGICPAPLKIGLGSRPAARYRRSEIVGWIGGGCQPIVVRAKPLDA